jgi:5,5'-dehydrodivanillate O-demethylase oxygenase subunit
MARRMTAPAGANEPERTGPGTLAGRYLRMFWQPVYHGCDLAPGRAVQIGRAHV